MYTGKLIFSQVMEHLPLHIFHQCVDRYHGNFKVKDFSCLDQYLCMAFAQLTYRESLRDIEVCLRAQKNKLYHMGIRSAVSRNNLANANKVRDWRIYADFAHSLIQTARKLYVNDSFGLELENTVYALDATTIDLCLSMFPWANFRKSKGAVKLHTLLDLRGSIPTFIHISDGKLHEVNTLDIVPLEAGAFYVMDRGYLDFARLYTISQVSAFFVIRAKSNLKCRRVYSYQADRATGLICDQSVMLTGFYQAKGYPDKLRRVKYYDAETDKTLVFLTNNFTLPAMTIADLYRCRWQVELFFKWIKQNLRIKTFYDTSENAVKAQIWIAVSVYLLVAIMKKRLKIQASLYTILQVLSVTIFERMSLLQALTDEDYTIKTDNKCNHLFLFS
ncbi:MAG: IS4 family transposase [Thermodesulfobacteriota bacterium]|nr:IS4 family transposase [Thermodesulfobacteriota bacterium]